MLVRMYEEYPMFTVCCMMMFIVHKCTCSIVFVEVRIAQHNYIVDTQGVIIQEILAARGNLIDKHQLE